MNKFLLVVALVATCSSPALAGSGKVRVNQGAYYVYPTPSWVLPLPRSERLANALGGWNRGYPADPYWDPCLTYSSDLGSWRLRRQRLVVRDFSLRGGYSLGQSHFEDVRPNAMVSRKAKYAFHALIALARSP